jgi:hypothetical protein
VNEFYVLNVQEFNTGPRKPGGLGVFGGVWVRRRGGQSHWRLAIFCGFPASFMWLSAVLAGNCRGLADLQ